MYRVCNDKKADGSVETGGELPLLVWIVVVDKGGKNKF